MSTRVSQQATRFQLSSCARSEEEVWIWQKVVDLGRHDQAEHAASRAAKMPVSDFVKHGAKRARLEHASQAPQKLNKRDTFDLHSGVASLVE